MLMEGKLTRLARLVKANEAKKHKKPRQTLPRLENAQERSISPDEP